MRLSDHEVRAIKAAGARAFGADAAIRLFGSRADDRRMGGDIDLHVDVAANLDLSRAKTRFEEGLFVRIADQQVDVICRRRGEPPSAIDLIAYRDGILL